MLEYLEKYGPFFIMVSIVGAFVFFSVKRDEKKEKEEQVKDTQKKTEDNQRKEL